MFANLVIVVALAIFNAAVLAQKDNCINICPDNYNPICGTDGKTYQEFPNECEFRSSRCSLAAEGRTFAATSLDMCRTELVESFDVLLEKLGNLDLSGCERRCHLNYHPICISNGKYRFQVSNQCIMHIINCALDGKGESFKVLQNYSC